MELDQFKQLWRELPEDSREEIRRAILSPEILERIRQLTYSKDIRGE
jgi:hypothetical protein